MNQTPGFGKEGESCSGKNRGARTVPAALFREKGKRRGEPFGQEKRKRQTCTCNLSRSQESKRAANFSYSWGGEERGERVLSSLPPGAAYRKKKPQSLHPAVRRVAPCLEEEQGEKERRTDGAPTFPTSPEYSREKGVGCLSHGPRHVGQEKKREGNKKDSLLHLMGFEGEVPEKGKRRDA